MGKTKFRRNTLSTREMRRIGEREQKRQERKSAVSAFWALSPEERAKRIEDNEVFARIQRNGITIDDLDRAGKEGYHDGAKIAAENTMRNIYAAVALVMHEKYGFGKKRLMDVLNAVDEKVIYALDGREMVQRVWDETGLEMTFDGDPLEDRIHEKVV